MHSKPRPSPNSPIHRLNPNMRMAFQHLPFIQKHKTLPEIEIRSPCVFWTNVKKNAIHSNHLGTSLHRFNQSSGHARTPCSTLDPHGDQAISTFTTNGCTHHPDRSVTIERQPKCGSSGRRSLFPLLVSVLSRSLIAHAERRRRVQKGRKPCVFQQHPIRCLCKSNMHLTPAPGFAATDTTTTPATPPCPS